MIKKKSTTSTTDKKELKKFKAMSQDWWKTDGKFAALHKFNPIRVNYIINKIKEIKPEIEKLNLLDIGCGGGLICEPLAIEKINVLGIDALQENIDKAIEHSKEKKLQNLSYECCLPENLDNKKFEIITVLELLEHVNNPDEIIKIASKKLNKNGILFISTINKTTKSALFAKFFAEYILRWVEKGTHDFNKFITPSQITKNFDKYKLKIIDMKGIKFDILKNNWKISNDISVNYFIVAQKQE